MPRRAAAVRREVQPDAKYNNRLVTQLINKVLLDGKKSVAERIVYDAFDIVLIALFDIVIHCVLECASLAPVGTVSNEFTAALRDEGFCLFEDGIVFFG